MTSESYYWFSYDMIKNMITQIMINFSQILVWSVRPYNMSSIPNFKSFGQMSISVTVYTEITVNWKAQL